MEQYLQGYDQHQHSLVNGDQRPDSRPEAMARYLDEWDREWKEASIANTMHGGTSQYGGSFFLFAANFSSLTSSVNFETLQS